MKYELLWRNKWNTASAESIDDMIRSQEGTLKMLRELKMQIDAAKVEGDFSSAGDDYIFFHTENDEVAAEFGFNEADYEEEDGDEPQSLAPNSQQN